MDLTSWDRQLAGARVTAIAPDGLSRAVVDGTGKLIDLKFKPELLTRPPDAVVKSVLGAVRKAQEDAKKGETAGIGELNDSMRKQIERDVDEAQATAERYLAEINAYITDLRREGRAAR
jgi:DNA-binding protein YbaB